jgi:hypothetical protein
MPRTVPTRERSAAARAGSAHRARTWARVRSLVSRRTTANLRGPFPQECRASSFAPSLLHRSRSGPKFNTHRFALPFRSGKCGVLRWTRRRAAPAVARPYWPKIRLAGASGARRVERDVRPVHVQAGRLPRALTRALECRERVLRDEAQVWRVGPIEESNRTGQRGALQGPLLQPHLSRPRDARAGRAARGNRSPRRSASRDSPLILPASPTMAFRVARLAGVGVDDILTGKYPPPGTCPLCGHHAGSE